MSSDPTLERCAQALARLEGHDPARIPPDHPMWRKYRTAVQAVLRALVEDAA